MKKSKLFISALITVIFVCSMGTAAFASNSDYSTPKIAAATSSSSYIQSKEVYSKITGELIGYVDLTYTKFTNASGRPQFDVVQASVVFTRDYYRGNCEITKATGDVVVVKVNYNNLGIDVGYQTYSFLP
ncbi:hypothetical protein LBW89_17915 [Paenibacillus sp. alder61]|uniref:DUF3888 domain-containing protein n=1 Tax=Paenibacillus faecis TaxID=862114 RepID=A0A5D0CQ23_9BACL|nr:MULTISPECIES: hypothetical protein [Paenibacillus]MCA1294892.1 hypothetical protein [Paenibacillus sp. alder61]TYA10837.1 hypothetical protein FRY98_23975 [Paenibacillus faecis]